MMTVMTIDIISLFLNTIHTHYTYINKKSIFMEKSFKENFSVFGKTTLRKFTKLKIYI